ncbi:TetR/AcrR family transcriptional regulator [Microbacterium suwonense]|uniref:HTH-type transcriptional regulator BetI n=1 Tax=Microbacterium suwonense TaxID=683047 RepID=A0ABN6X5Z1_9MICO|nr:TetR/AcrR family transcriptional regulator [Microbacterium suwonense]BDZ39437.1 HTH-type transcriptional regulator BetI [Microbacterium suwonense]
MPKVVDHAERRAQIAEALLAVIGREGLAGVSLRRVAAEAGVTAGMVQHYFASKDEMVSFAMQSAGARYEARIRASVEALGPDATPAATLRTVLTNYIPRSDDELHDGRISLEFQSHAGGRADLSRSLGTDEAPLLGWFTMLVAQACGIPDTDAAPRALGLFATAEGLGLKVISAALSPADALTALDVQLELNGIR